MTPWFNYILGALSVDFSDMKVMCFGGWICCPCSLHWVSHYAFLVYHRVLAHDGCWFALQKIIQFTIVHKLIIIPIVHVLLRQHFFLYKNATKIYLLLFTQAKYLQSICNLTIWWGYCLRTFLIRRWWSVWWWVCPLYNSSLWWIHHSTSLVCNGFLAHYRLCFLGIINFIHLIRLPWLLLRHLSGSCNNNLL